MRFLTRTLPTLALMFPWLAVLAVVEWVGLHGTKRGWRLAMWANERQRAARNAMR